MFCVPQNKIGPILLSSFFLKADINTSTHIYVFPPLLRQEGLHKAISTRYASSTRNSIIRADIFFRIKGGILIARKGRKEERKEKGGDDSRTSDKRKRRRRKVENNGDTFPANSFCRPPPPPRRGWIQQLSAKCILNSPDLKPAFRLRHCLQLGIPLKTLERLLKLNLQCHQLIQH